MGRFWTKGGGWGVELPVYGLMDGVKERLSDCTNAAEQTRNLFHRPITGGNA